VVPGLQDDTRRPSLWAFLAVTIISGLALIWPVYPLAADIRPFILGLPLSFAWVVGWLVVMFVALVLLYRSDLPERD
jgi:polyferredoxin